MDMLNNENCYYLKGRPSIPGIPPQQGHPGTPGTPGSPSIPGKPGKYTYKILRYNIYKLIINNKQCNFF